MVKSKLPPRSGSSLEVVEPHQQKGAIKFFFLKADHVLTIKTLMDKYLSENKKSYFCFVAFRKAYDTIHMA